jgi:hypothetical protein
VHDEANLVMVQDITEVRRIKDQADFFGRFDFGSQCVDQFTGAAIGAPLAISC